MIQLNTYVIVNDLGISTSHGLGQ